MKRKLTMLVFVLALVALVIFQGNTDPRPIWRCDMTVHFSPATSFVNFGTNTHLEDMAQYSISVNLDIDGFRAGTDPGEILNYRHDTSFTLGGFVFYYGTNSKKIFFATKFSGGVGFWETTSGHITTGYQNVGISYDSSSPDNDPIIYYNGVSVPVGELSTPSGTVTTYAGASMYAGSFNGATEAPDGKMADLRIYNKILTPAHFLEIVQRKSFARSFNPLFQCRFLGAAGLQSFDGVTLGAANKFTDHIQGVRGTPGNSPVGRDDVTLAFQG